MWPELIVLISIKNNPHIPLNIDISNRPNPFSILCQRIEPYVDPLNGMLFSTSQDKAIHTICRIRNKYKYSHIELPPILECNQNKIITQFEFEAFLSSNTYKNMIMIVSPRKMASIFHIYKQTFQIHTIIQIDHNKINSNEIIVIDIKNKTVIYINENNHIQTLL